ncbi:G-protein coupled receptor 12 [Paralichthys olivaceus]|uniref:G-protein coupled receptor 12 n=1 Tax=Paralichthys olivaceus TaxID=8255 RepID=UPI00375172B1
MLQHTGLLVPRVEKKVRKNQSVRPGASRDQTLGSFFNGVQPPSESLAHLGLLLHHHPLLLLFSHPHAHLLPSSSSSSSCFPSLPPPLHSLRPCTAAVHGDAPLTAELPRAPFFLLPPPLSLIVLLLPPALLSGREDQHPTTTPPLPSLSSSASPGCCCLCPPALQPSSSLTWRLQAAVALPSRREVSTRRIKTGGTMSEEPPVTPSWLTPDPTAWASGGGGPMDNSTILGTFPPDDSLSPSQLPLLVNPWDIVLCTSGTLIACENALVVLVIWQNPALRAPMFLLIGSLALADLLAGLGLVLHFTCAYLLRSDSAQLLTVGLVVASFSASVFSLLAITIDRYLSLYYALTYNSERTAAFTYTMLVLLWGLSLCLGLLPVTGVNCLAEEATCSVVRPLTKNNIAVLSVSFLLLFGLMLQLYVQICKIVMRHAHQIALQHHFLAATPHYVTTRKGVSTLAIILGTFAACWMPFTVYSLIADYTYPPLYTYATLVPATYNSVINPVIYAFRNQEIQKALWLVCCGCVPASVAQRARTPSDV